MLCTHVEIRINNVVTKSQSNEVFKKLVLKHLNFTAN